MAYDGFMLLDGEEFINVSRTAQLAEALGIDTVWIMAETVDWIQEQRAGVDWDVVTTAPWYDAGYSASAEFAGFIPLSITGLDDSSLEAQVTEYLTDGGSTGRSRNTTQALVFSVAIIALTERGAAYGKRWLDRKLKGNGQSALCVGARLDYYPHPPANEADDPVMVHRNDVKTTRGTSITRKRYGACSATWWASFTMTAGDPYEYGEPEQAMSGLGSESVITNPSGAGGSTAQWQGYGVSTVVGTATDGGGSYFVVSKSASGSNLGMRTLPGQMAPFPSGTPVTITADVRNATGQTITGFQIIGRDDTNNDSAAITVTSGSLTPVVAADGAWHTVTVTATVNLNRNLEAVYFAKATSASPAAENFNIKNIKVKAVNTLPPSNGTLSIIEQSCPAYDYTPLYDPLYPALVSPPNAPDFLPDGWTIEEGDTFVRSWARATPVEPSHLNVVPLITLHATAEERMVRVSVWPSESGANDQCDPLWSAVITYLPPGLPFVIDGEMRAAYVDTTPLRRTDSLVYDEDADPVQWSSFNDPDGLLVTVDRFNGLAANNLLVDVAFVPKSD